MGQNVFPVHLVVEQVETVVRSFLRFLVQLPLKHPDFYWCFKTHRQSPLLSFFKSTSEVRVLPSTGITRHQRYCDPLRLPGWPPSCDDVGDAISASPGSPPITQITFPTCRAQYPGGSNRCLSFLPHSRGLPRLTGGSASTTSLSRPAQALLALRPATSQPAQRRTLVPRLRPAQSPDRIAR